ncbi:MAG: hypothetical protein DMF90_19910 [Acidobacteria bacterium]|nr:MAG: hypothetical protein DMF90_19910 [Acidobacteriota bacterium]
MTTAAPTALQSDTPSPVATGLGRDFWLFRLGQAISVLGDSCGAIALSWWILDATGSAVVMSSVLAPAMVVRIVLTPLFGPLGDRVTRKKLIIVSDLWRGALTMVLAVLAYEGRFALPAVIGLYVLTAIGSALYGPPSTSIVPQLVSAEKLNRAFQQSQAIASAGAIVGGLTGGALVGFLGVPGAFAIDAISFFVGAATAQLIRADTRPGGTSAAFGADGSGGSALTRWTVDLKRGFRFLYAVRVLFVMALVAMLVNFLLAPMFVVLPVLVKLGRGLPPWYLGALESGMGAGAILGALGAGWLCRKILPDRVVVLGIALTGIAVAALPWMPGVALPILATVTVGMSVSLANIPIMSQLAVATPDSYRSRVSSIMLFLCQGVMPLGVALAGVLLTAFGFAGTMTGMGVMTLLLAPTLFAIPHLSGFFRRAPQEAAGYLEALYPRAFAAPEEA